MNNELQKLANEIYEIVRKSADYGVVESWGLSDFRVYSDVPILGNCWSACCNGLQYGGRIFVAKGEEPNTLTIAKEEAFGKVLSPAEFDKVVMKNLSFKKAVHQLDRWIERGNLSEREYEKLATKKAKEDLRKIGLI